MPSDIVIRVENLSKKYTIRHQGGRASGDGLRHAINDVVSAPWRFMKRRFKPPTSDLPADSQLSTLNCPHGTANLSSKLEPQPASEDFYALKDVSFEVKRGAVLGIIGRNGAGKSTLLKILSRITEPTIGRIGIKGRIASLLEVGTGFHPELTGRENIYLNGAILGMIRAEVRSKFDEIVDFSGVENFLDTPVKRYSSGMYVRLAFAVAAHLEPEILIVDEVLAVGDADFQEKCFGKMKDVARSERTVIFVSHDLTAVAKLCETALLLQNGTAVMSGPAREVTAQYFASRAKVNDLRPRGGSGAIRLEFFMCKPKSAAPDSYRSFHFAYAKKTRMIAGRPFVILEIRNDKELLVVRCDTRLTNDYLAGEAGDGSIILISPWLIPGEYSVTAYIDTGHGFLDVWENACEFDVTGQLPYEAAVPADAYKSVSTLSSFTSEIRQGNRSFDERLNT